MKKLIVLGALLICVTLGYRSAAGQQSAGGRQRPVDSPLRGGAPQVQLAQAQAKPAATRTAASAAAAMTPAATKALVDQYCVTCHNSKTRSGGLVLENMDMSKLADNAQTWEKVITRIRAGMMPPLGAKRPEPATMEALVSGIETELDRAAALRPNLVPPGVHRLNRVEYANAVKDLLALDVDPSAYLPVDDAGYGFDNIAASLSISPALVEGYMSAAAKISRIAVGHETAPSQKKYIAPQDYSQENHIEGLPLGTRGGMLIKHYFHADGEYVISWFPVRGNTGELYGSNRKGEQLEVLLDGVRVGMFDIDKLPQGTDNDKNEIRLNVKAGLHNVGLAFLASTQVPIDDMNQHYVRSVLDTNPIPGYIFSPQVGQVIIMGPYDGKRPQTTASREKIFVCRPANGTDEVPCAKKILGNLARQAFRRPVTDQDLETLLTFYQKGRNKGDFEDGIEIALQEILSDPEFVFRGEADHNDVKPGEVYRISDLELASRLAFFLWSAPPDQQLIDLATQNKLHDPKILDQQTRRLLADPRSEELIKNFAGQWLQLRNLPSAAPVTQLFPDFDDNLRQAFRTETELFFDSIVREDRSLIDLLNADYTFVNERLAKHYGIPNIYGSQFRRVTLGPGLEARRGLLGQGSMLLITSISDRTSPVQRGKWVLLNILGIVPPEPPPNVPPLKTSDKMNNGQPAEVEETMRHRMEEHRANPYCASCHVKMDPIGFMLENFDAVGKWRTVQYGQKLDVTGQLADGVKLNGPIDLRQQLMKYSPQFVRAFTEKLLTYAIGRGVEYYDMPAVRAIAREAGRNNYRFSSIVQGIVRSQQFQMNLKQPEGSQVAAR
jgi:mono/diheme cytochrome c family protein